MAPILRSISTSVIPHVMSLFDLSNVLAIGVTVKETVKKSNASLTIKLSNQSTTHLIGLTHHVQAKKESRKKFHWRPLTDFSMAMKLGGFICGGFSEVMRVAAYWPMDGFDDMMGSGMSGMGNEIDGDRNGSEKTAEKDCSQARAREAGRLAGLAAMEQHTTTCSCWQRRIDERAE